MTIFKKILVFILIIFLISFFAIESLIILGGRRTYSEHIDYLFILGAGLYGDKPSPSLIERLEVSKEYLKENKDLKVLVCGGQGEGETISEAKAMKDYLVERGINENRIILEANSVNTFENIKFGMEEIRKFDDRENLNVLIATSRFHIFRSKFIGKRLGVVPFALPAKVPPSTIIKSYLREYFGVTKSFFVDK